MKVAATSDWRDGLAFETPVLVADVLPGDDTRCSICGSGSQPRPRTELWAVKSKHPKHHGGHVRFYCRDHLAAVLRPAAPQATAAARVTARPARAAPRRAPAVEKVAAVCPDCFVEIPATGVCGICGRPAD